MPLHRLIKSFECFLDLIDVPIAIIDTEGTYVYYNQASAEIDQIPRQVAMGANILTLYKGMNINNSTMLQAVHYGRKYRYATQIYHNKAGQKVEYVHSTSPIYDSHDAIIGAIEVGFNNSMSCQMTRKITSLIESLTKNNPNPGEANIIFKSTEMAKAVENTKRIADKDIPIMIYGETGTGKELFARLAHQTSGRRNMPFIALNCAAIPGTLIESLMFGSEKGAYTGAEKRKGYIELAEGGTLFLDELNSMPMEIQPKLLRYLQDRSYWRLGGDKEIKSDVRVIVAVNEDPLTSIKMGKLRQDLYYRLCIGYIYIPNLSERIRDIAVLADHFIKKHKTNLNDKITVISDEALALLESMPWEGNVRMLENTIIRSLINQDCAGELLKSSIETVHHTSPILRPVVDAVQREVNLDSMNPSAPDGLDESLRVYERQLIVNAMNRTGGCVSKAARELRLHRSTLQYKLEKHNVRTCVN